MSCYGDPHKAVLVIEQVRDEVLVVSYREMQSHTAHCCSLQRNYSIHILGTERKLQNLGEASGGKNVGAWVINI